jgi:DNA-binding HxlR family transcriptional regulator
MPVWFTLNPVHTAYGQFCPVALAAEIVAERWTPLILRELLNGSHRFNDLHRGLPRISRALLTQRLGQLEKAGLLQRRPVGSGHEYHLTAAGQALRSVIEALGTWGYTWAATQLREDHLDPGLLMWFLRRRLRAEQIPEQRTVVRFEFHTPAPPRNFWLILHRPEADLCVSDPGFDTDLHVSTDVQTMVSVYLGRLPLRSAIREGAVRLYGPAPLRRAFVRWIGLSPLARPARSRP